MIAGHGGNCTALAARLGCSRDAIIDMSSNLNPLGPPPGLENFIRESVSAIRNLPQADAHDMVMAFGHYHDIDPARIMAANGTTWFIYTLPAALKSRKMLILGPTYSDYRDGCIMQGVDFDYSMAVKETRFTPDLDRVAMLLDDPAAAYDTVVVCNPNNPTGALVQPSRILDLVRCHPRVCFVVDESYLPFVDNAQSLSLVRESRFSNLVVLSSMSKVFTIPGLRTGFITAAPEVISSLMTWYQPWSVNALAQAAVVHLLENGHAMEPFIRETRAFVNREKALFEKSLAGFSGLVLYPSSTYFLLAELTCGITSQEICRAVGDQRILIRDCANFEGLSNRFVRFSLKTREINMKLISVLAGLDAFRPLGKFSGKPMPARGVQGSIRDKEKPS
ncbi:MAG: threonine-phosphate decarboxylase [Pseudomonadota bacterium]